MRSSSRSDRRVMYLNKAYYRCILTIDKVTLLMTDPPRDNSPLCRIHLFGQYHFTSPQLLNQACDLKKIVWIEKICLKKSSNAVKVPGY